MTAIVSLTLVTLGLILGTFAAAVAFRQGRRARVPSAEVRRVLPFESGSIPQQHAVSRHHVRWYAVTVLFLAFDMEMIFMYPWAVVVADVGASSVIEMFGFLAVLLVGVVYVWREGALRWS